jgi:hypothetical protein
MYILILILLILLHFVDQDITQLLSSSIMENATFGVYIGTTCNSSCVRSSRCKTVTGQQKQQNMRKSTITMHIECEKYFTKCQMGFTYDFYANRWRMCSISYYFRNSSASINNVTNVNYDIDLYVFV